MVRVKIGQGVYLNSRGSVLKIMREYQPSSSKLNKDRENCLLGPDIMKMGIYFA